jgi:hypothetical protein
MATWTSIKNKISHNHEKKSERPYEKYECYFKNYATGCYTIGLSASCKGLK